MSKEDNYGFFGPEYSFADDIKLPGQIGVRQEPTFSAILDSVGGINYYIDTIAFGSPTAFNGQQMSPLGIRYFLNTEMRCSNGATMSEYFDGVTKGNILGKRVEQGLMSAGLPGLKGLVPGMMENARDALDPRPIFAAISGTGYPVCQKVACPVGTVNGGTANSETPDKPFILGSWELKNGLPYQTRWVQDYNTDGSAKSISSEEFAATPKCYNPDGSYMSNPPPGCLSKEPAEVSAPASGKYDLCVRLKSDTKENFEDVDSFRMIALTAVLIGGLTVWFLIRR